MDLRTELTRRVKRQLFAPASLKAAAVPVSARAPGRKALDAVPLAAGPVPSSRPDELKARIVDTPSGTFGHLRIFTFHMQDQDIEAFLNEVARLLSVLPPRASWSTSAATAEATSSPRSSCCSSSAHAE